MPNKFFSCVCIKFNHIPFLTILQHQEKNWHEGEKATFPCSISFIYKNSLRSFILKDGKKTIQILMKVDRWNVVRYQLKWPLYQTNNIEYIKFPSTNKNGNVNMSFKYYCIEKRWCQNIRLCFFTSLKLLNSKYICLTEKKSQNIL